jgi:hypothetical protein
MDFAQAWSALAVGDTAAVSNGAPRPGGLDASLAARIWRSHNFTAALAEKAEGTPRRMRFQLAPDAAGNAIGYWIAEDGGHAFVAVD